MTNLVQKSKVVLVDLQAFCNERGCFLEGISESLARYFLCLGRLGNQA